MGTHQEGSFQKLVLSTLYKGFEKKRLSNKTSLSSFVAYAKIASSKTGLDRIVTFNYDDILENLLSDVSAPVWDGEMAKKKVAIEIDHVNGFVPVVNKSLHCSKKIVFSEDDYHSAMANPTSWSQGLQSALLSEYRCLFLGCSLSDPDLRLILDTVCKDRGYQDCHYAIMVKKGIDNRNAAYISRFFARIGVLCVWFDDYSDIPLFFDDVISYFDVKK